MAGINQKIKAVDYNAVQSDVQSILGTGIGLTGYGQPVLSSQVTTSDAVTINEYAALRYDIINIYKHLYNSTPSGVDAKSLGEKVRYNALSEPIEYWSSVVTSMALDKNQLAVAGQRQTINHGTVQQVWPGPLGTYWDTSLFSTVTVSFSNSEQARWFFNAGGSFQFTSSRTGGSSTNQNTSWTTLLSTAGTRIWGGQTPGTDVNPNDGTNWWRCTDSFQDWSVSVASSPYSLNEFRIGARTPGVSDNSSGTAKDIEFYVLWLDNHVGLGGPSDSGTPVQPGGFGPDSIDGTISLTVQTVEPTGVLEPTGSGNFTVQSPTVTVGAIQLVP